MRLTTVLAATAAATVVFTAASVLAGPANAATPSHFTFARADWTSGARGVCADRSTYWNAARRQLAAYGSLDARERSDLAALISIPPTGTSAAQRASFVRVVRELNGFFDTPGSYGVKTGDALSIARTDWVTSAHVAAASQSGWLAAASDELGSYGTRYRSEQADLASLRSIPLTDTTAKQRATAHHDVVILDAFFHTPGLR